MTWVGLGLGLVDLGGLVDLDLGIPGVDPGTLGVDLGLAAVGLVALGLGLGLVG